MNIPKVLRHIWIGPDPAPIKWMASWQEYHKDWTYELIDNQYVSKKKFYNHHLIEEFMNRKKDAGLSGAADIIRYEILYEYGGLIAEADSICLANTDELWTENSEACYTVYENELLRPGYVSPIYACNPKNKFLEIIIDTLHKIDTKKFGKYVSVFRTTGNAFLAEMIKLHNPNIKIFPSHYFIPCHFTRPETRYSGNDKIYAEQMWGTTKNTYSKGRQ